MMKKKSCETTEKSVKEEILKQCTVGRMATIDENGYPYIVPLNYVYWQGKIYFHCAHEGEKIANISRDSRVCFEVDIPLAYLDTGFFPENTVPSGVTQFYNSVIIRGKATIVTDLQEKIDALNALVVAHEPGVKITKITSELPAVKGCKVVAISIESMTGKQNLAQSKPEHMKEALASYLEKRGLGRDAEAAKLITGKE